MTATSIARIEAAEERARQTRERAFWQGLSRFPHNNSGGVFSGPATPDRYGVSLRPSLEEWAALRNVKVSRKES